MKKKYAVIKNITEKERNWYTNERNANCFKVSFYSKLDTGLLADCLWKETEHFTDKNADDIGIYNDYNSPTAKSFGIIKANGNLGSFSDIFDVSKRRKVIKKLKELGYIIIRK